MMKRWWWVGLFVSAQLASAQPSGQAGFAFGVENAPVWDLSGIYSLNSPLSGAGGIPISLSYTVVIDHESRGALSGEGTAIVRIDDQPVAAYYTVRGSVSGNGEVTRANFNVSLRGRDWIIGAFRSFNIKVNYRLEIDPTTLELFGRVRGNASFSGLGSASLQDDEFFMPLPPGADGTWAVALNFIPFKNFAGTASILVARAVPPDNPPGWPDERVMAGTLKGSYSASKDLTKATVKTLYEETGSSLNITFFGENDLNTLRGKILGQTVRVDAGL